MRRLAGPWCGGGLERKRDRQHEGTGLGQPQLTGCGRKLLKLEESRERGQRAAGGSGGWAGGEVGSVVPLDLGRVEPEGLARSCPQVTRPLKDKGGETGLDGKGWNGNQSAEGIW